MYEALCEQNMGLVIELARLYRPVCALDRAVSVEDLVQSGFFALVQAAQSYDPAKGKTWAAWAAWHIMGEFRRILGIDHGQFIRPDTGAKALDRPLRNARNKGTTLMDKLVDDSLPEADAALIDAELRKCVRTAVARLPEGQRQAMELCGLRQLSAREAAVRIGMSPGRVRRLYDRAEARLSADKQLRTMANLDERTRFHAHKGVAAFNRDWTSVTEGAALWRIEQRQKMEPSHHDLRQPHQT